MDKLVESIPADFGTVYLMPWAIRRGSALAIFIIGRSLAIWLVHTSSKLMKRGGMANMLAQLPAT